MPCGLLVGFCVQFSVQWGASAALKGILWHCHIFACLEPVWHTYFGSFGILILASWSNHTTVYLHSQGGRCRASAPRCRKLL